MSSNIRQKVMRHLDLCGQVQPALHEETHAPAPDQIDNAHFRAYTRMSHDVGGEPDVPIVWEEKEEEVWEHNTFVTCEVLAWRGVWNAEERRRRQNVDVGQTQYLGLPYYGRWLLGLRKSLVERGHISDDEIAARVAEIRKRG